MVRRPDLGYRDEGIDFGDPRSFDSVCLPFGEASQLARAAYRSLQFLYLEDEAVWTREWVPVGTIHEIPGEGDILPFTLGYHGVHVQRMEGGALSARFNMAQHGGCRTVPTQCQQGKRTNCSFTSCGYSRDRGPISKVEGQDDTRTMYQYLGLRPERLHPVHVAQVGSLLFLNIDPGGGGAGLTGDLDLPGIVHDPDAQRAYHEWREFDANWKFSGQTLARSADLVSMSGRVMQGRRRALNDRNLIVHWVFPNMVLLSQGAETCVIVLQHTAIMKTMFRIEILSDGRLAPERLAFWREEISHAGDKAEALQRAIPALAPLDKQSAAAPAPPQQDVAAWWAQTALVQRFAQMPQVDSDIPIFRNVEHYLI